MSIPSVATSVRFGQQYSGEEWPDITIRRLLAEVRRLKKTGLAIANAVGVDGEVATITTRNPQASSWNRQWKEIFAGTPLARIPLVLMHSGMEWAVVDQVE